MNQAFNVDQRSFSNAVAPPNTRPLAQAGRGGGNKLIARNVSVFHGEKQALFDVNIDIRDKSVTAFIGAVRTGVAPVL